MHSYPFTSITINGRDVEIDRILSGQEHPESENEAGSVQFIKDWLTHGTDFTIGTSGSTGVVKPITINRTQMQSSARLTVKALKLKKKDVAFICLNTRYIAGKMMLVRAFEAGLKINIVDPIANPLSQTTLKKIDFTAMVPLQIQTVLEAEKKYLYQLNQMKAIIVGGATVHAGLKKEIQEITSPVYATYGMTETISHIALQRLNGPYAESSFKVLPGVTIQVDERGCLVIQAPYLSSKIITNDLVEHIEHDRFRWLGRWDNVINTGGIKVIPEKIEQEIAKIFSQLDIHQSFYIQGLPDDRLGSKVVLVVEGQKPPQEELIFKMLKQTFSKYEMPKELLVLPQFVYTETGKINRKKSFESM